MEQIYFLRKYEKEDGLILSIGTSRGFILVSLNENGIEKLLLDKRDMIDHGIRLVIPALNSGKLTERIGLVGGGNKPLSNGDFVCWNDSRISKMEVDISTKTKISNIFITNEK